MRIRKLFPLVFVAVFAVASLPDTASAQPPSAFSPGSFSAQDVDVGHVTPTGGPDIVTDPLCAETWSEIPATSRSKPVAASPSGCWLALAKAGMAFLDCLECQVAIADPSWANFLLCLNCMKEKLKDDEDVEECWEKIKEYVKRKLGLDPDEEGEPGGESTDPGERH